MAFYSLKRIFMAPVRITPHAGALNTVSRAAFRGKMRASFPIP